MPPNRISTAPHREDPTAHARALVYIYSASQILGRLEYALLAQIAHDYGREAKGQRQPDRGEELVDGVGDEEGRALAHDFRDQLVRLGAGLARARRYQEDRRRQVQAAVDDTHTHTMVKILYDDDDACARQMPRGDCFIYIRFRGNQDSGVRGFYVVGEGEPGMLDESAGDCNAGEAIG